MESCVDDVPLSGSTTVDAEMHCDDTMTHAGSLPMLASESNLVKMESTSSLHQIGAFTGPLALSDSYTRNKDTYDTTSQPGISGLHNLGNTCFMNAGLQCLLSNTFLVKFMLEVLADSDSGVYTVNDLDTVAMQFSCVLHKIWSGQYSSISPSEFKKTLGTSYPQFKDFRQHDAQEFIALFLDNLHEHLNTANMCKLYINTAAASICSPRAKQQPNNLTDNDNELSPRPKGTVNIVNRTSVEVNDIKETDMAQAHCSTTLSTIDNKLQLTDIESEEIEQTADNAIEDERSVAENVQSKKLPSLADLYMKDTKTLNTNVLAQDDDEEITTDSEKFHKPDNQQQEQQQEPYEQQINDFLTNAAKGGAVKSTDDSNLLENNLEEKFQSDNCAQKKFLFSELLARSCDMDGDKQQMDNINNIKRMKIDEDSKNARMQCKLKMNTNINVISGGHSEVQAVMAESSLSTEGVSGPHPVHRLGSVPADGPAHAAMIREADHEWQNYLANNHSVIVDTFQGQFKSTVICSECEYISVTYEPFMYLSVPLPHAMDRQICVTFVPCDSKSATQYLVTVNKVGHIHTLRALLLDLIGDESCIITLAEVFNNHISRILEDNTMLRYVNDTSRTIYAFEMMPAPSLEEEEEASVNTEVACVSPDPDTSPEHANNLTDACAQVCNNDVKNNATETVLNNMVTEDKQVRNDAWGVVNFQPNVFSNINNSTTNLLTTNNLKQVDDEHASSVTDDDDMSKRLALQLPDELLNNGSTSPCDKPHCTTPTDELKSEWKSCAICLEDMLESALMVHPACNGTLCHSCLEMSFKHYGELPFVCPVCTTPVDPIADFIQLSNIVDYKAKPRILSVPVVQRLDTYNPSTDSCTMDLVGHPNLLQMSSNIDAQLLYDTVDRLLPCDQLYTIVLTDGQGLHCSRCLYTEHCRGCELSRDGLLQLQPGDTLAVRYTHTEQLEQVYEASQQAVKHVSMSTMWVQEPLTIYDCFNAFTESEDLDEHNPWYCPRCRRNQCAQKTLAVWRLPQVLVVYLKRFVFHDLLSSKIDNKVVYPLTDLDMADFIVGPKEFDLKYDLQSCVCHFGGVNSGHYTAYAKHSISDKWYYYNDETTTQQDPHEEDYKTAYVLFYQRKGADVDLPLPAEMKCKACDIDSATELPSAMAAV